MVESPAPPDEACDLFVHFDLCRQGDSVVPTNAAPTTGCVAGTHVHDDGNHPSNNPAVCHGHSCEYSYHLYGQPQENFDCGPDPDTTTTTTTTPPPQINPPPQNPVQTPTTTTPPTTTTTPPVYGCVGGQHRHDRTGVCHTHPVPSTCGTDYQTINGYSHRTETTSACPPQINPPPQNPVQTPPTTTPPTTTTPPVHGCASGQHRDDRTGVCHTHPVPSTCGTTYLAINGYSHSTETTSACPPAGRWVDTCPVHASGMHGHSYWQPASLPWPSDALPYGRHGCASHTPPACSNTGLTTYQVTDTSVFSEYSWPVEGPRPAELMARLRAGEIFFHAAATVPQCQPVNTCRSNPAHGHVPASVTDISFAGHGCDDHAVPACAEYGDPSPTYVVHDPAGSDTWPGHRLVTVDTHHNSTDTYCHTVPVCVPASVVAEAAATTNPRFLETYDGPGGVPPSEYWHLGSFLGALDGVWLHYRDSINQGTPIPECSSPPPPPGPGTVTVTVTAPYRLVHGGLLHPEPFTAAVTGFSCTGFCGDGTGPAARIETVDFGLALTATNGYLREPDQAPAGTGEYAVTQCVPTPTHATLVAECAAVSPNDVTTSSRVVAVVGLFYNATLEAATVADSQRVRPLIIGFTGTYRYWFMQNGVVTSATAPLTATVVSTAGADGQKVWSSLIVPD